MLTASDEPLDIDVLALPETTLILLAAVIEPLRAANRIAGRTIYRWRILTPEGEAVETASQLAVPADGAFRPEGDTAPLFVLASYNWRRSATSTLKMQLSRTARHRTMIAGIEAGTWLLAEASLLDNVSATTHWEDFEEFAAAYPQVRMVQERFVIDGKRITTGGSLPTIDLMLDIIRRRQGYSLAHEVTRLFIYRAGGFSRGGSRLAFDDRPQDTRRARRPGRPADGRARRAAAFAGKAGASCRRQRPALCKPCSRKTWASRRMFTTWRCRLNAARRNVIETKVPFADIAAATGFNSSSAFARSYRAHFSESASDTRKRLRGTV